MTTMALAAEASRSSIHLLLPTSPSTTALAIMATSAATTAFSRSINLYPNRATTAAQAHLSAPQARKALHLPRLFLPPPLPRPSSLSSPLSLSNIQSPKPYLRKTRAAASLLDFRFPIPPLPDTNSLLTDSTRTISSIFAAALLLSKVFLEAIESISVKIVSVAPANVDALDRIRDSLVCSVRPLFFAAINNSKKRGRVRPLKTPVSVVSCAVVKWLDIYCAILMVRILLTWLPNIAWDRQPFSTIRDLCDPYYNLFRQKIPPVFNIDISVQYAFLALDIVRTILDGMV